MDREKLVLEHERLDDLQNGYMLIQNPKPVSYTHLTLPTNSRV